MIPRVRLEKVDSLALLAVGVSIKVVELVWADAYRFQSWSLQAFTVEAYPPSTIKKVKRCLEICSII